MDWLERILFALLGCGLTLIAGFIRDRWTARRAKVSDIVKKYIEIAEKEPFQNEEAHRLSGMVRAGVPLLKDQHELDEFFSEVTGRGFTHPWQGSSVNRIFPKIPPLTLLRAMAADSRMFSSDVDIYDWLLYEVTKKRDDQADPPSN